eukprot:TRINITY_DN5404_c0_g1_i1.p1 TRINITY_DN5404_c0_g1~~TRINITY_DN5404_c0_g1_i1.p1  ORF type:complete len:527 (-),score=83.12 TRINITY_DN5404_c0_g1_i1:119-1699(-)
MMHHRYLLVTLLLISMIAYTTSVCTKPRIRRAWSELTLQEQHRYIKAITLAYESGHFDRMSEVHWANVNFRYAHFTSGFFPWHRWFIWKMENYLRSLGPEFECLALTYWDWEYHNGDPFTAGHVLNPKYFGSVTNIPGCVTDGFFVSWTPGEDCVRRTWNRNYTIVGQKALADLIVNFPNYGIDAHGFRSKFEAAPHSNVHNWLGGKMGTSFSTYDPIFYHHHSNVDRLYSMWQDCHDYDAVSQEDLGFDEYAGNDPNYNGIDVVIPFGSKYIPEILTPRVIHHITGNKMIEMEYQYSPHRFPGLINQHYQNKPCKWNWMRTLSPNVPATDVKRQQNLKSSADVISMIPERTCEPLKMFEANALQVAEENELDGSPHKSLQNLSLGYDSVEKSESLVGIRFLVDIPSQSTIVSAHVSFVPTQLSDVPIYLKIEVEQTTDSVSFYDMKLSERRTAKKMNWNIINNWTTLRPISTPDISQLLQYAVDDDTSTHSRSITFILRGVQPNIPNGRYVSSDTQSIILLVSYC